MKSLGNCVRIRVRGDPRRLLPPPTAEGFEAFLGREAFRVLQGLRLESRAGAEARLRGVVEKAEAYSVGGAPQSVVAAVVGEWGLGKSHAARIIEDAARRIAVRRVVFDNIVDVVGVLGSRLGRTPNELEARQAIEEYLSGGGLPAIVVVDEVESLISAAASGTPLKRVAADAFFDLVKGLLNPEVEAARGLRGRLHLVLLLTPAAFHALRSHLQERGIGGKLLRRIEIVRLRPLLKHESLMVARAYLESSLGIKVEELFSDPRLLETYHEATGGNPGNIVYLAAQTVIANTCPDGDCVCKITPERMLSALINSVLVDEAGETYPAVDRQLAQALLEEAQGDPEAIILALGSASTRPDTRTLQVLGRLGLDPVQVILYTIGGPGRVSAWLSTASRRACGAREECREELARALSHLLHADTWNTYTIGAPKDHEVLASWLEYLGWEPESGADRILEGVEGGVPGYALPPDRLARLLSLHGRLGAAYLRDPGARERVREVFRRVEADPERFAGKVAEGLAIVLREALGLGDAELGLLAWEPTYKDVVYRVMVRPDPSMLAGGVPECPEKALVQLVLHYEDESPGGDCPLHVQIPLAHGTARRLALLALAYELARESLDEGLVREEVEDIARGLQLEQKLHDVLPRLERAGILVTPQSRGIELARRRVGTGKAGKLLADTHKLLVAMGGARKPVNLDDLTGALTTLTRATPYVSEKGGRGRRQRWCGALVPSFSVLDIKDEKPENLALLFEHSLQALVEEGLARAEGLSYYSTASGDPLLCRLLLAGGVEDDLLDEYFILPKEGLLREQALERLEARMEAAQHLGVETALWNGTCQPGSPTLRDPPAGQDTPRRLYERVEKAPFEVAQRTGVKARHYPAIVICKKKACKAVTRRVMEDVARFAERILKHGNLYPAEEDFASRLVAERGKALLNHYADLVDASKAQIIHVYGELIGILAEAEQLLVEIMMLVDRLVRERGLNQQLAQDILKAVKALGERLSKDQARIVLARALNRGDRLVETVLSKGDLVEAEKQAFMFEKCKSTFSPHAEAAVSEYEVYRVELDNIIGMLRQTKENLEKLEDFVKILPRDVAKAVLSDARGIDAPISEGHDTTIIARELARSTMLLYRLSKDRAERATQEEEKPRLLRGEYERLEKPAGITTSIANLKDRIAALSSQAELVGDERLDEHIERAKTLLSEAETQARVYQERYEELGRLIEETACIGDYYPRCEMLLQTLREIRDEAKSRLREVRDLAKRVDRLLDNIHEAARQELAATMKRVTEWTHLSEEAGEADISIVSRLNEALREAEQTLHMTESLPPGEAVAMLRQAVEKLEEAARALLPRDLAALYDLVLEVRRRGGVPLRELLEMLARAGWEGREGEAIMLMERLAERLGFQLVVSPG